jgi:hypothetical protein
MNMGSYENCMYLADTVNVLMAANSVEQVCRMYVVFTYLLYFFVTISGGVSGLVSNSTVGTSRSPPLGQVKSQHALKAVD